MKSLVYYYKLYKGKNSITLGPYFWLPGTMLCLSTVRLFPEKLFQCPLGSFVCFQWYDKISMWEFTQESKAYHWYMLTISLRIFCHFICNNIYKTAEHRQMKCIFVSLHLVHNQRQIKISSRYSRHKWHFVTLHANDALQILVLVTYHLWLEKTHLLNCFDPNHQFFLLQHFSHDLFL